MVKCSAMERTSFLLLLLLFVPYISARLSNLRACADPECRSPLSLGVTVMNYQGIEPGMLSFRAGDEITIFSKSAGENPDVWGAEIRGRRGYVPKRFVREMKVYVRQPLLEVPTEPFLAPFTQQPGLPMPHINVPLMPNEAVVASAMAQQLQEPQQHSNVETISTATAGLDVMEPAVLLDSDSNATQQEEKQTDENIPVPEVDPAAVSDSDVSRAKPEDEVLSPGPETVAAEPAVEEPSEMLPVAVNETEEKAVVTDAAQPIANLNEVPVENIQKPVPSQDSFQEYERSFGVPRRVRALEQDIPTIKVASNSLDDESQRVVPVTEQLPQPDVQRQVETGDIGNSENPSSLATETLEEKTEDKGFLDKALNWLGMDDQVTEPEQQAQTISDPSNDAAELLKQIASLDPFNPSNKESPDNQEQIGDQLDTSTIPTATEKDIGNEQVEEDLVVPQDQQEQLNPETTADESQPENGDVSEEDDEDDLSEEAVESAEEKEEPAAEPVSADQPVEVSTQQEDANVKASEEAPVVTDRTQAGETEEAALNGSNGLEVTTEKPTAEVQKDQNVVEPAAVDQDQAPTVTQQEPVPVEQPQEVNADAEAQIQIEESSIPVPGAGNVELEPVLLQELPNAVIEESVAQQDDNSWKASTVGEVHPNLQSEVPQSTFVADELTTGHVTSDDQHGADDGHDHSHDGHHHSHDGHDHSHDGHYHSHDGHDLSHDGHDHSHDGHDDEDHQHHDHGMGHGHSHGHGHGHSHIPGYIPGFGHHYRRQQAVQQEAAQEAPAVVDPQVTTTDYENEPQPPPVYHYEETATEVRYTPPAPVDEYSYVAQPESPYNPDSYQDAVPPQEEDKPKPPEALYPESSTSSSEQGASDWLASSLFTLVPAFLDLEGKSSSTSSALLFSLSLGLVTFLTLYYLIQKSSREGALLARISQLDTQLYEAQLAKDQENPSGDKLAENDAAVLELKEQNRKLVEQQAAVQTRLADLQQENEKLLESNAALEKELEAAAEAGLEVNNMLTEVLASQSSGNDMREAVEALQQQLNKQQLTMEALNQSFSAKCNENELLAAEMEETKEELEKATLRLKAVQAELEALKQTSRDYQKKMVANESELLKVRTENETLVNEKRSLANQVTTLNKETLEVKEKLNRMEKHLKERDGEIQVLQELLQRGKGSNEPASSLLDFAHLKAQLTAAQDARDDLEANLKFESLEKTKLEVAHAALQAEMEQLRQTAEVSTRAKREAETRLEVLSTYFKEKEAELHKELGSQEAKRALTEENINDAVHKAMDREEQLTLYKSQVETLKKEIEDQERSFKSRLAAQEKRAHESWVAARQAERRLEEVKQEAAQLRHRLTQVEKEKEAIRENGSLTNGGSDVAEVTKVAAAKRAQGGNAANGDDLAAGDMAPVIAPAGLDLPPGVAPPPPGLPFDHMFGPASFMGPPPPFMPPEPAMIPPFGMLPPMPPPPPPLLPPDHRPPPLGMISSASRDYEVGYRREMSDPPMRRFPSPPRRYPSPIGSERSLRSDRSDRLDRYDDHYRPISPYGRHGGRPRSVGRSRDASPDRTHTYSPLPSPPYGRNQELPEDWEDTRNLSGFRPHLMRGGSLRDPQGPKTSSPITSVDSSVRMRGSGV